MIDSHVALVFAYLASRDVAIAVVGRFDVDTRRGIDVADYRFVAEVIAVRERGMRGVEPALHRLQIIAFLVGLGHKTVRRRRPHPFEIRWLRHRVPRPHKGPYHPAAFD